MGVDDAASLDEELALEEELAIEGARARLLPFVTYLMPSYEINWHHVVMARALDDVCAGKIKRLMIFTPPRAGKSELLSRKFPAFYLGHHPDHHVVATSYSHPLAKRGNRDVQRAMDTPEYRSIFPGTRISSVNTKQAAEGSWLRNSEEFEVINRRGLYRATSTLGSLTGFGMHLGIIDDPIKNRQEANSVTYRNSLYDWYTSTFYSRLEKNGAIVLCLTRWHEDDLASRLLRLSESDPGADKWTTIILPQIKEDNSCDYDPRQIGDVLWPNKFSAERVQGIRVSMGERDWASLHQQRPAPLEGGLVKRAHFKFYKELPLPFDAMAISCDLNMKPGEKSDFTVMQVWGRKGADFYLIDQVRDRMGWLDQKRALPKLHKEWPDATSIYIEDAANGPALVAELKSTIGGLIPVQPRGDKFTRLEAVSGLIEAGNVYFPEPEKNRWVFEAIDELCSFPNSAHDDICDALSQALSQMRTRARNWSAMMPTSITKTSSWLGGR